MTTSALAIVVARIAALAAEQPEPAATVRVGRMKHPASLAVLTAWVGCQVSRLDLRTKAPTGCRVRIALGDPSSPKLLERGNEEKFGIGIVSRAELALKHYEPLRGYPGAEVHIHATTLYRFDDVMLVNTHVWGLSAFGAPVVHLRRLVDSGLFDMYAQSFEAVWATAKPAYE
jgi:hypothetical protein